MQKGKPLPEKGTCRHYKQSHRWLRYRRLRVVTRTHRGEMMEVDIYVLVRFPCCGRAYPCDVCHDEDQDHPMELATRMICGYCAKEQVKAW